MNKDEQDALINKSVLWGVKFAEAVIDAGGNAQHSLSTFSAEGIQLMVRNGLVLKYDRSGL